MMEKSVHGELVLEITVMGSLMFLLSNYSQDIEHLVQLL